MENKKLVSFVLPVYNEEKNIYEIYQDITKVMGGMSKEYAYEIIFVDDGSQDESWQMITLLCQKSSDVRGIHLSRNFGKEIALSAGIDEAKGNAVITLDSDGQHPIDKIRDFLICWEEGYDIVYNTRFGGQKAGFLKQISSTLFYKIFNSISEFKLEPGTTDYRLLDRKVVDAYKRCGEKNRMYRGLIDWLGFKRKSLIFPSPKRIRGNSGYSFRKLLKLAVNNVTSFSFFPLKFVGFLGVIITLCASGLFMFQILDKIGVIHLGFSSLGIVVVINTIMTGTIMMSLGLIGLYVANINEESMHRPLYIIKEKIN